MLDVQRRKVVDSNRVRSIVTECYDIQKETQHQLFKTVVVYSEIKSSAYKTLFLNGIVCKEELVPINGYRQIWTFNLGNEIEWAWYDSNGEKIRRFEYSYDKVGNKIKELEYEKSSLVEESHYTYNSHNDCTKYHSKNYNYDTKSEFIVESKWTYLNYPDRLVKKSASESFHKWRTNNPTIDKYTEEYVYNSEGQLLQYKKYKKKILTQAEDYEYSNKMIIKKNIMGKEPEIRKYNQLGDIVFHQYNRTCYVGGKENSKKRIESMDYKYDGYGNWVECRCYDPMGNYIGLFTRTIEYID